MEGIMVNEMFWTHCCHCGYRISKSAPGTKSLLVCPKCGSELEVAVDGKAVKVSLMMYTARFPFTLTEHWAGNSPRGLAFPVSLQ